MQFGAPNALPGTAATDAFSIKYLTHTCAHAQGWRTLHTMVDDGRRTRCQLCAQANAVLLRATAHSLVYEAFIPASSLS